MCCPVKISVLVNLGFGSGRFQCLPVVRQWILCVNFVIATEETSFAFYFFFFYANTSLISCWKFGSPYLGRSASATLSTVCGVFVCPDNGMTASVWD